MFFSREWDTIIDGLFYDFMVFLCLAILMSLFLIILTGFYFSIRTLVLEIAQRPAVKNE